MNITEAYGILGVPESISDEDLKKAHRKLAAQHHPDTNKDPQSPEKAKQINAAYQYVKEYRENPPEAGSPMDFFTHLRNQGFNVSDFISFSQTKTKPDLIIPLEITFAEAVLGVEKEVSFNRDEACSACSGSGALSTSACSYCQGRGFVVERKTHKIGNREVQNIIQKPCSHCQGQGFSKIDCLQCSGRGDSSTLKKLKVKIPAGIQSGQVLRLQGAGHHVGHGNYAPSGIKVGVIPQENMSILGMDVISKIEITLLEALTGINKNVQTVLGPQLLQIPSKTRNGDRILLAHKGVGLQGSHVFQIVVSYPSDVSKLITTLQELNV